MRLRGVLLAAAAASAACSLLVDTGGLSGGADASDGGGTRTDATTPTPPPGAPPPGGGDASSDAGADVRMSSYRATVLADGPQVYLRLGDASGATAPKNEVTSSIGASAAYGGAPVFGVPGAIAFDSDTAVRFDEGASARIDLGNVLAKPGTGTPESFELWFQPLQPLTNQPRFLFDRDVPGGGQRYDFFAFDGKLELERHDADGGVDGVYDNGANLVLGTWYHLVVTLAGMSPTNGLKIYVNGSLAAAADETVTLADAVGAFVFGAKVSDPSTNAANGAIDELAIYTHVLTPARILAHYNAGIGN